MRFQCEQAAFFVFLFFLLKKAIKIGKPGIVKKGGVYMNFFYKRVKNTLVKLPFLAKFLTDRHRPSLVLVTNHWEQCPNEPERQLCRALQQRGYYASPEYAIDHLSIDVALVPYRVALMRNTTLTQERKIARYLERKGWTLLFYDDTQVDGNFDRLLYQVDTLVHPPKNASLT